jgi:acyl-CoA reductase-like NAD-dependent aldehyde dehydrogenase
MPFSGYDRAVEIANRVSYGLTAAVFTRDLGVAHRFARDVEAGYVWVNDASRHFPGTPYGGFKDSGIGREESLDELLSYTQVKNVNVNFG